MGDCPAEVPPPSESTVYRWLGHAAAAGLAVRTGRGTRDRPWRYRLAGDEVGAANGLPPLWDLG